MVHRRPPRALGHPLTFPTTTPEDQTMTPIDTMTPDQMREALRALFGILYVDGREADGAPVVNPTKPWCSDTLGELSTWAADFGIAPEELDEHAGEVAYYAEHCLRAGQRVPRSRLDEIPDSDDYEWRREAQDEDDGLDEVLANERNYPSSTKVL